MLRKWEQYAIDHQLYEDQMTNCKEWQKDFSARLASCVAVEGDKFTLQNKLSKAQELLSSRDDGFGKLQQVIDQAHLVLPNTSAPGKETINGELSALHQNWDDLTSKLNSGKTQLELATSQWTLYEESCASLSKWLSEVETSMKQEIGQQASLPEKRSQLDKIKVSDDGILAPYSKESLVLQVLALNVGSQQPSFAALIERAETLSQTTQDPAWPLMPLNVWPSTKAWLTAFRNQPSGWKTKPLSTKYSRIPVKRPGIGSTLLKTNWFPALMSEAIVHPWKRKERKSRYAVII